SKRKDSYRLKIPKHPKDTWDKEYNLIIPELSETFMKELILKTDNELEEELKSFNLESLKVFMQRNDIRDDDDDWKTDNAYRIFASKPNKSLLERNREAKFNSKLAFVKNSSGDLKLIRTDFNRKTRTARIELVSAKSNQEVFYGDNWTDIATTAGIAQE